MDDYFVFTIIQNQEQQLSFISWYLISNILEWWKNKKTLSTHERRPRISYDIIMETPVRQTDATAS